MSVVLGDLILDARAVVDGDEMGVVGLVVVAELPVIARPVALDGHRAAVDVEAGREAAGMGRAGGAVGHDVLRAAALGRPVEMHHLLDEPEILLGELGHHLVDMGVADIDGVAVDGGRAVEHHAIAEAPRPGGTDAPACESATISLSASISGLIAAGGTAGGLGHLGDDEAHRQEASCLR